LSAMMMKTNPTPPRRKVGTKTQATLHPGQAAATNCIVS
jgi:hypothetical protein